MPVGASPKREREYEKLKKEFRRQGRYRGREKEVASRIVNKQRAMYGETKAERQKDRAGKSPDRGLPVENYQHLTVPQVKRKLAGLDRRQLRTLRKYEARHKERKSLLQELDRRIDGS